MKKFSVLLVLIVALLYSCDKKNAGPGNGGGDDENKEILLPTVTTIEVVDITATSAICIAEVENAGAAEVTKRGVEYACASFSEPDNDCDVKIVDAGSGLGEFQCEMTDLNPNETYYVRAFATNKAGTSYGEEISFVTLEEGNEGEEDEETKINGYEYVDLGLPSGLKWATCNVGASSQYEVGDYFAWGELKSKERFGMDNCPTYGVPMEDISGNVEFDVAAFAWGSTWRMPTEAEFMELRDNCKLEWTMIDNNTRGCFLTGPNGNQIYLPSGGFMTESSVDFAEDEAAYWTSTPDTFTSDQGYSTFVYFYSNNFCNRGWMSRYVGMLVRPVSE